MASGIQGNPWAEDAAARSRIGGPRVGGLGDAADFADSLGFALPPQHALQNQNLEAIKEINDTHRMVCELAVEVEGREDNHRTGHVTSEASLSEKAEAVEKVTALLAAVAGNKERVISRLQQHISMDCLPVEMRHQEDFERLLRAAAADIPRLEGGASDARWVGAFNAAPGVWEDMMQPLPSAVASCMTHSECVTSVRHAMAALEM